MQHKAPQTITNSGNDRPLNTDSQPKSTNPPGGLPLDNKGNFTLFSGEKPAQEIFPIEACQALAKWFLHQVISRVSIINAGGLNEKSWGICNQISQEKKRAFVDKFSQDFFNNMKDIKLIPEQTRALPISISEVISYVKEAGFPELCIPKQDQMTPMAWLISKGEITFDDGFELGYIYSPEKSTQYQTQYLVEPTEAKTEQSRLPTSFKKS